MAGRMDLLGSMKDDIVSPERVVSIKGLDQTIAGGDGGLRIGAAVKIADLAEHAAARKMYPALVTAADGVGTPQIRNMGTVGGSIMQRPRCWCFRNEEFNCLKKGGSRCFAVEGENQFHAIFGDGPCHIVHPSSLAVPVIAYGGTFRVAGPNGAREIDAGEFFQLLKEIRGKVVAPGVYTLRYGLQPQNGDHLGISTYRDCLLISPASVDTDPKVLGFDGVVALSKQVIGTSHPAALSLDPPEDAPGAVLSTYKNDLGHDGVVFEAHKAAGTVKFGLIVSGLIVH